MSANIQKIIFTVCFAIVAKSYCIAEDRSSTDGALSTLFSEATFKEHIVYLASDQLAGRAPGSEGSAQAAQYIIENLTDAGINPLKKTGNWFQEFPLGAAEPTTGSITGKNILGMLPGRGALKEEAVIVSAHYDHLGRISSNGRKPDEDLIYNGADDNASGVAAVLMIAKAVATQQEKLPNSHRTIIFALFDAEERGLLGAKFYVRKHPEWPLDKTAAIINFDAMGRLRMGKFFASDSETNPILAKAVRTAAQKHKLVAETQFGGHGRSDHAVFLDREIPGMHFFTGANPDYHHVTDEWQQLNLEGGATIARIGFDVLQHAISHPQKLTFQKLNPGFDISFALNLMQVLGIVPNVNAQAGDYPEIMFVVPNSPAAKHGLKGGDKIKALNGLEFTRVEDALSIFPQLTFEKGIRAIVLRDNVELGLHLPASIFESMSGPKSTLLENGKYEVVFLYKAAAGVKEVFLAGEFNKWQPKELRMEGPDEENRFAARLELKKGVYEYKFVLDGKDWTPDPKNMYRIGKYNNSVLWVGRQAKPGK